MHTPYIACPHDPSACDLTTWFNIVGAVGCVLWIVAYGFAIHRGFKDKTYGFPMVAICLNFTWEFLAAWIFPNVNPLWLWFNRIWFLVDIVIVYQLVMHGPKEQKVAEIKKWFYPILTGTLVLACAGQYAFVEQYQDFLAIVTAFMINLIMSVLFIFMYFDRRDKGGRGLSKPAGWCKMLGTVGTAIECHYVVGLTSPQFSSLSFLTFLCLTIFVMDGLYMYFLYKPYPVTADEQEQAKVPAVALAG
jgi:hypothetical protein